MYQQNKEYDQTILKNLKEHLEREFNTEFKEKTKVKKNDKWVDIRSAIFGWKLIINDDDDEDEDDNKKSALDL